MRALILALSLLALVTGCRLLPDWLTAPTPAPTVETPCVWQWANQPLPDVSASLQAAADEAGVNGAIVSAYAFGENCLNADGSLRLFAARETDYRLSGSVGQLAPALKVLLEQIAQGRAGARPGRIELTIDNNGIIVPLQVAPSQAAEVIAQGLSGEALLAALKGP